MQTKNSSLGARILSLISVLVIARHGKAPKASPDQKDEERALNELGRSQAEKLREKISSIRFDAVFTSPLKRAYETTFIATGRRCRVSPISELTCPTDGVHPIDVMFNDPKLGYAPLNEYFKHGNAEHLRIWGQTAVEKILDALEGSKSFQTVAVGGHAVLQNALVWAICETLENTDEGYDVANARKMAMEIVLGECEAFKLTISQNPHHPSLLCEHIKLN